MAYIELRDISKSYSEGSTKRVVLSELDLSVDRGEFVVLMGRSGAGKSTLLNLMGGLDAPSSGHVRIGDHNVAAMTEEERTLFRREHIGFVFQSFNLIPTLTVLENVLLPADLAARSAGENGRSERDDRRDEAMNLLEEVGLADRADTYPDRLSGGEQQRVAIVRALSHRPMLLLADEPTGNLDYETGKQVMDLLHEMVRKTGTTLLVVTHDRDFLRASDRILGLRDGKIRRISLEEIPGIDAGADAPAPGEDS